MLDHDIRTYHALYDTCDVPRLYNAPWWLDAVCGHGEWQTLLLQREDGARIGLPYYRTRIRGLSAVITPIFSQWVSPVGAGQDVSTHDALLRLLPSSAILDLCLLPWKEGSPDNPSRPIQLKYTYVIHGQRQSGSHRHYYNEGLKRNLKAAESEFTITPSGDAGLFFTLCKSSYQQRGQQPPRWLEGILPRVNTALQQRACGRILLAYRDQQAVAGIMMAWDSASVYYLAGGRDDQAQSVSAHALLLDHAIHFAMEKGLGFDFEGSMHPGIANFFQAFGASPQPYWHIRQFTGLGKWWSLFHTS